jgi:flagellar protein FlaJ
MLGNLFKKRKKQDNPPKKNNGDGKSTLQFDLLYQLSYMSVIASAGVPREQIFKRSAHLSCATAEYFRRIDLIYRRLKCDYAQACRIVGETAGEEMKGLLLRFSSSLVSGEPEADFLVREAEVQAEAYENDYIRKIESLKMWTDAYISLSLSAVLVIIIGIVSTMIWNIETAFILGLVAVAIFTTAVGVWLIYLMSPKEVMVLRQAGSLEQKLVQKVFRLALPGAVIFCALLGLWGLEVGWMLIAAAVLMFPVGWLSNKDDRKVMKRDNEVGALLGSLGGVCAAIGTTVKEALERIDLDAINTLKREVKRLHTRLLSGISPKLSWDIFVEETGSELTNRSVGMFYDAIDLGGEPQKAGYHASLFANKLAMLRAKRKTITSPFRWLCVAMHASVVALLIFITEVMGIFGGMLHEATQGVSNMETSATVASLTSFNFGGLEILRSLLLPLVIVLTISDASAPSIAEGGSRYKFCYNFGITALVTGLFMISLPSLATVLFSSVQL